MVDEDAPRRFKLLGVRAVKITENRLMILRGRTRLTFEAPEAAAAWTQLDALTTEHGAAIEDVVTRLDRPQDGAALALAELLISRGLLVEANSVGQIEGVGLSAAETVYWWDQGRQAQGAREGVTSFRAVVLGVNAIGEALWASLRHSGFSAVRWIDLPALRNADSLSQAEDFEAFLDSASDIDLLVVCSDAGAVEDLRDWNAFSIAETLPFLPVLFDDSRGLVGPWVQPNRSACFECFWRRWSSVDGQPPPAAERRAQAGPYAAGHLPAMASLLAQAAAIEINRAAGGLIPNTLNGVMHYDLQETSLTRRPLLKAPFCPVCGPMRVTPTLRRDGDGLS